MFRLLRDLSSFLIAILETLLAVRFVLKLLAASPKAQVVDWIYHVTQPFLQPFSFAFPTPALKGGLVIEFTTLFAFFAYAFIGYIVQELLEMMHQNLDRKPASSKTSTKNTDSESSESKK